MKTDWTRSLIEASVRYALNKCGESPERESRNLVDLGLQFSSGELQKHKAHIGRRAVDAPRP